MDQCKTGALIRALRLQKGMTQRQLAERLLISDKAVSKWERGQGCPDVSLLSALSAELGVNIDGMLAGELKKNPAVNGNMLRAAFYICPQCGNIVCSTGSAAVICCGSVLEKQTAKAPDRLHTPQLEKVEDEWYVSFRHPMSKEEHLTFAAKLTSGRLELAKFYPEGEASCRFKLREHGLLLYYCTSHGLFATRI